MVINENEEKIIRFREANESTLDIFNLNKVKGFFKLIIRILKKLNRLSIQKNSKEMNFMKFFIFKQNSLIFQKL
jgi:hypothetical protein